MLDRKRKEKVNNSEDFPLENLQILKALEALTPEQKLQLIAALQPKEEVAKAVKKPAPRKKKEVAVKSEKKDETFTTIKQDLNGGKVPVKFKKNSWKDNGEFRDDEDLKTPKYEPAPRNRERSKKVEVECHVCGKTFFEDPRYIYGEFLRCSKCCRR